MLDADRSRKKRPALLGPAGPRAGQAVFRWPVPSPRRRRRPSTSRRRCCRAVRLPATVAAPCAARRQSRADRFVASNRAERRTLIRARPGRGRPSRRACPACSIKPRLNASMSCSSLALWLGSFRRNRRKRLGPVVPTATSIRPRRGSGRCHRPLAKCRKHCRAASLSLGYSTGER